MTEQTKGAKWAFRNAPNNTYVVMRHGGDIGNLSRTTQTEELLADANAGAAMQGIGNPEAVREVIEAARETVWARMGGTAKDRDTAQIRLKKALAALEQETIP